MPRRVHSTNSSFASLHSSESRFQVLVRHSPSHTDKPMLTVFSRHHSSRPHIPGTGEVPDRHPYHPPTTAARTSALTTHLANTLPNSQSIPQPTPRSTRSKFKQRLPSRLPSRPSTYHANLRSRTARHKRAPTAPGLRIPATRRGFRALADGRATHTWNASSRRHAPCSDDAGQPGFVRDYARGLRSVFIR